MKKTVHILTIIAHTPILFLLPCTAQSGGSIEWISVEGNHFVNESGETIVFKGVNIPVNGDETYGKALVDFAAKRGIKGTIRRY